MMYEELEKYKITISGLGETRDYYLADKVDEIISELRCKLKKSKYDNSSVDACIGVNVKTNNPKCGDILVILDSSEDSYDDNGDHVNIPIQQYFIDLDTFDLNKLEVNCKAIGVVVENENGNVLVHYYKGFNDGNNKVMWASAWLYELTDMSLDGNEHKILLVNDLNEKLTFTHTETSLEGFCKKLDTFLRDNQCSYQWHCEYMKNYKGEMSCIVIVDEITSMYYDDIIYSGDCTENKNMAFVIEEDSEDSLDNTDKLGKCLHKNIDGRIIATFPLFYWTRCLSHETKIDWYIPSRKQYVKIYNNIDKLNKSLKAIGGNTIDCSQYRWSCVRDYFRAAWNFNSAGYVNSDDFNYGLRASCLSYVKVV